MKKKIASMLAATVMLFSVIALPASAQTDWLGNSDLTTAKVREIADADTLTESQIAEINNHYSEYEIMQGISKTLIEDYAARINLNFLVLQTMKKNSNSSQEHGERHFMKPVWGKIQFLAIPVMEHTSKWLMCSVVSYTSILTIIN